MNKNLTARSPAKLILSGEHSVMYGQPAIAMAVNRYTEATATYCSGPNIRFKLSDISYAKTYTLQALRRVRSKLQKDYLAFLNGERSIRSVLKRPFELLQYSVSSLIEHLNLQLPRGVEIKVNSGIPMGCGMGSSAAAIISTLHALAYFFKLDWKDKDFLSFGLEAENLQHGRSSGLDLHLVTYGGCVKFMNGAIEARDLGEIPIYIVNTGKPATSTGECVTHAASKFAKNSNLADEFGAITQTIDQSLLSQNIDEFKCAVKENNKLLCHIGVVPDRIKSFIAKIESNGGAAKICGAGAVAGDNAGIVLISSMHDLTHVAEEHGYELQTIQVDKNGTKII